MSIDLFVWKQLEQTQLVGEELASRLALPEQSDRLQCALDAAGHRHLLVPLLDGETELHDSRSRGLTVTTRTLTVQPASMSYRCIDIECQEFGGFPVLDFIADEIVEGLSAGQTPQEIVERSLARWRRFWSGLPREILTREEVLGLFGELWFLYYWLLPNIGLAEGVRRWRGPSGARHDFEWPARSVEVKATTNHRGRIHQINGAEQLAPPREWRIDDL